MRLHKPPVSDGEPEGPEYIFGRTTPDPWDLAPSSERIARMRAFRRVGTNEEMQAGVKRVYAFTNRSTPPPPGDLVFAHKVRSPEKQNVTYVEIPDGEGRRPALFAPITHDPEIEAEQRLDIENIVLVDKEDMDRVSAIADDAAKSVQRMLLEEGAALLLSFDNASAVVEASMRDALGVEIEIDSSVSEVLSHMMRLNIISAYLEKMSIPEETKQKFLAIMTEKIAEDAHSSMTKASIGEKYSAVLKNLSARIKGDEPRGKGAMGSTPRAVLRRGSDKHLGPSPREDGPTADLHDYNEQQAAGVRTTSK